jgi:small subunit ribosomal protein S20
LPEQGQHFAAEPAYFAIRQNGLKSVSHLRPVLPVAYGEQHHHAAVFAFWPYAPFLEKAVRKILNRIALERADGHDGKLRICFPVQFLAQGRNLLARLSVDHAGEIVDVTLRGELLDLFRSREIPAVKDEENTSQRKRSAQKESGEARLTKLLSSATVIASHREKEQWMAQGTPTKIKKRKKSVLKRAAQSLKRSAVNRANRTRVRSVIKSLRSAIHAGDSASAGKLLSATVASIDRAVAKGVLAKNTANRYKSRLALACNALQAQPRA